MEDNKVYYSLSESIEDIVEKLGACFFYLSNEPKSGYILASGGAFGTNVIYACLSHVCTQWGAAPYELESLLGKAPSLTATYLNAIRYVWDRDKDSLEHENEDNPFFSVKRGLYTTLDEARYLLSSGSIDFYREGGDRKVSLILIKEK